MVEHAAVNGTRIAYTIDGPANAPVLTMSHSLSADHSMWDPQMSALTDAYRVVRFDTRGHGASDVPAGEYTLDQLASDVISLWDHLGIESTHYCGLSMGGMIGQTLALKAPERLRTLVLCDTASSYPPEAQAMWQERIVAAKANGLAAGLDGTIDRWFSPGFVARAPAVIAGVRKMIAATPASSKLRASSVASTSVSSAQPLVATLPWRASMPTATLPGNSRAASRTS